MSDQITAADMQQYASAVELRLQQKGSRLRDCGRSKSYTGAKSARAVNQIGAVVAQRVTGRHSDTPLIQTPHAERWVFPFDYVWADLLDHEDTIRTAADFESPYAMNGANALGRAFDDEIITALVGNASTGENGGTTVALTSDGGSQIASSSVGLTVAKLRSAKRILMAAEVDVDTDQLFVGITAEQHDDMLNETQAISIDYNNMRVLPNGKITSFMGFDFKHTERLTTSGGERQCPAWARSGLVVATWNDIEGKIAERPDKNHATQVFTRGTFGATRTEGAKVVDILCAE